MKLISVICTCLLVTACSLEQDTETNTSNTKITATECQPSDCGPEVTVTCVEGTELTSEPICEANAEGACEWNGGECTDVTIPDDNEESEESRGHEGHEDVTGGETTIGCQPEDCGPQVALACEEGSELTHETTCEPNIEGVCEWNIGECVEVTRDNEPVVECQPEDCGPQLIV